MCPAILPLPEINIAIRVSHLTSPIKEAVLNLPLVFSSVFELDGAKPSPLCMTLALHFAAFSIIVFPNLVHRDIEILGFDPLPFVLSVFSDIFEVVPPT